MAHKNPAQIERLIVKMRYNPFDFYIHLDKKTDIEDYKHLSEFENVFFIVNRTECNWGGYSFVTAIVNSLTEVLNSGRSYGFINLMSGQDYPIKPVNEIYEYLSEHKGKSFLAYEHVDHTWWEEAVTRFKFYHLTDFKLIGRYLLQKIINKLMPSRKFPLDLTLYGSANSSWWTISTEAADYLVRYIRDNTKLRKFMRFTWGADEFLITTIIMNSPFRDKVINDNLRYIDWSQGGAHPKTFSKEDFQTLVKSDKCFARKFDIGADKEILDLIDQSEINFRNNQKTFNNQPLP